MTGGTVHRFFATTCKGVESALSAEIRGMGGRVIEERPAGVAFEGTLRAGYRAWMWSRTASRIHLVLHSFEAPDEGALYEGARSIPWQDHVLPSGTIAVDCTQTRSPITHTGFAALRLKDAVVDVIREQRGSRPSVRSVRPDVRINLHLEGTRAIVAIDLAGEGLHRRGYRTERGEAPLRENLAAAVLLLARWPERAGTGEAFLDPMCGSGTLTIEAAMIAADVAPGLGREHRGFEGWLGHDPSAWREVLGEARERAGAGLAGKLPFIGGSDASGEAIGMACGNASRAKVAGIVRFGIAPLASCDRPAGAGSGIVVLNPPYGIRMGADADGPPGSVAVLGPLYEEIGDVLRRRFTGWTGYVLTGSPDLAKRVGLRPSRRHVVWNGAIECRVLEYPVSSEAPLVDSGPAWRQARATSASSFTNRLAKNAKHLARWAGRESIECYRVYDADIPEYAIAVDRYGDAAVVQEYEPPADVDRARARTRLEDALAAVGDVLGLDRGHVHLRVRRRQRGGTQYGRQGGAGVTTEVREGGLRFEVNLTDYLDTGLMLDLRNLRAMIRGLSAGKKFLNLFSYTGTATVFAAAGGAARTTSVDMSATYVDWARRNMARNGFVGRAHELIREDCLPWMSGERRRWDVVLLAPPTFSRSKRMAGTLDIQRDHVDLVRAASRLLAPRGTLLFVASARRFEIDADALADLSPRDITGKTVPKDFARSPRVHQAWILEAKRA